MGDENHFQNALVLAMKGECEDALREMAQDYDERVEDRFERLSEMDVGDEQYDYEKGALDAERSAQMALYQMSMGAAAAAESDGDDDVVFERINPAGALRVTVIQDGGQVAESSVTGFVVRRVGQNEYEVDL